jgi:hypothetical protein
VCSIQQQIDHSSTCPICRQEITIESLSRNLDAEKQTDNLLMWCRFHFEFSDDWLTCDSGCPELVSSALLESHEMQCQYSWSACRFSVHCNKMRKKELKTHELDCIYRTTDCQYCFAILPYSELLQHELECRCLPVECDHCGKKMKSGDLEAHELIDCKEMLIRCPYFCDSLIPRKELVEHNALYVVAHLDYVRLEAEKKYNLSLQVIVTLLCVV